jgi:glutathione peroxidase
MSKIKVFRRIGMSVYDFTVKNARGQDIDLHEYAGKVLLIVNVASKCGFTPQYTDLEKLYLQYQAKGLEILGFPCDQFAHQEPGTDEEIQSFCQLNYGVTFPVFAKIKVNGPQAHPLYKYLRSQKGDVLGNSIKWNFTKFLIDKKGTVVERYASQITPFEIAPMIEELLE